jgi:chromosome segregation ATPase
MPQPPLVRLVIYDIVLPAFLPSVDGGTRLNVSFRLQILGAASISYCVTGGGRAAGKAMTDANAIDAATRRLAAALEALEAAVERRRDADKDESALAAQIHALDADRSRLASELDSATARARALEATNRDIAQRLDVAIDTVRQVVEAQP